MSTNQPHLFPKDEEYLSDFHKEWNEACMRANEKMALTPFSLEQLKDQCRRLTERAQKEREALRNARNR